MPGIKIDKVKERVRISKKAYETWMLENFSIVECKPWFISLPVGILLFATDSPET